MRYFRVDIFGSMSTFIHASLSLCVVDWGIVSSVNDFDSVLNMILLFYPLKSQIFEFFKALLGLQWFLSKIAIEKYSDSIVLMVIWMSSYETYVKEKFMNIIKYPVLDYTHTESWSGSMFHNPEKSTST